MVERLTRVEQQARTRQRVLDAAQQLFAEQGYAQTSVAAVAERAGFTKGAVYANFASKEDLVLALFDRRAARRWDETAEVLQPGMSRPEMAAALTRRYIELSRTDRAWAQLFSEFAAIAARSPEIRERLARHNRAALDALAARVEQAGLCGPMQARAYAAAVFVVISGVTTESGIDPDLIPDQVPVLLAYLFQAGIAGDNALPDFAAPLLRDADPLQGER